ncbi:MAG: hypothetical protein Q9162_006962 [Coniocarpon cinnabarinum]
MDSLPTIVLLPGAFITIATFDPLLPHLHELGFPTIVASYPSASSAEPYSASVTKDTEHIRNRALLPLLDDNGKDVILFAHSFGGIVGVGAAVGLGPKSREGKSYKGRVLGLFYVAATILPEGRSLRDLTGGQLPPSVQQDQPIAGMATSDGSTVPHATAAFTTPAPKPAWIEGEFSGRRRYLRTMQDASFPPQFQSMLVQQSGVEWDVVDIDAPHEAHSAQPQMVASLLQEAAQRWTST